MDIELEDISYEDEVLTQSENEIENISYEDWLAKQMTEMGIDNQIVKYVTGAATKSDHSNPKENFEDIS